ncbi:unnamed protein product [Spirodela intermedia]|uniref:Uncharacterized protein n=1 Tax=Spirodela intermedia TaxID=51605 RepID=A0A7I8KQX1_SPIIN|nr:unnamed protein product [Spirodela intermedia]
MEEPLLPVAYPEAEASGGAASQISSSVVAVRLTTFVVFAVLSLWANHEASKGFQVAVLSGGGGTAAAPRFDLMFVSNGRAARALLSASGAVERVLFSGAGERKRVDRVTLQLAPAEFSGDVAVLRGGPAESEFTLQLSSRVVFSCDGGSAMAAALRRGMAEVWLWDGQGAAPPDLLDAMAEFLSAPQGAAGGGAAARLVRRCEGDSGGGFVARLNVAMKGRWRPEMVAEAVGSSPATACRASVSSAVESLGLETTVGRGPAPRRHVMLGASACG